MTGSSSIRVRDLMSKDLFTIDGLVTVEDAMALMKRHRVGSLVVNRRNEDDELGLITVGDIAHRVIAEDRSPERVIVYEIMSKPLLTLPEDMLAKIRLPTARSLQSLPGRRRRPRAQRHRHGNSPRPHHGLHCRLTLTARTGPANAVPCAAFIAGEPVRSEPATAIVRTS